MRTFYARDLIYWPKTKLWALIEDRERFTLKFDDGEIETTFAQTLISWYFWDFHRTYPELSIDIKYHIFDENLTKALQNKLEQRAMDAVLEIYPDEDLESLYRISRLASEALHNDIVMEGEEYQDTMDALDLLQLHQHPKLRKILDNISDNKHQVNQSYQEYREVLAKDPSLNYNGLAVCMRSGQVKVGQLLQVCAFRGYCSEIDQRIFQNMVWPSFMVGLKRKSFHMMDSRSASQADMATTEPVKKTEYYNRQLQLVTYVVKYVSQTDCGSRETIPWEVVSSDLDKILPGKYYFDEDGSMKMVRKSDRHLVGRIINIRSPALCHHPDDGVICKYCLCENAQRIQKNTNAGFAFTVTQNETISQDVISTKHHLISATSEKYDIDDHYLPFINNDGDEKEIALAKNMWTKHVRVRFNARDIPRLADITLFNELAGADPTRISNIKEMVFLVDNGDKNIAETIIPVSSGSYRPYLSSEFIQYMKDNGFGTASKYIEVDLGNWDNTAPLLRFPDRRGSTLELMEEVRSEIFMSSKTGKLKIRADLNNPEILAMCIRDISDLTNRKFSVNLGIVELILYAMMARDPKNGDYRLPKKGTGRYFAPQMKIMNGRSLSAKTSYERQYEMVGDPKAYIHKFRPNYPFDHLLLNVNKPGRYS